MSWTIIKLTFSGNVRFGERALSGAGEKFNSGQLFSALFTEYIAHFGEAAAYEFCEYAQKEDFLLSDLMPYRKEKLFLPKPTYLFASAAAKSRDSEADRKLAKKIKFVDSESMELYLRYAQANELDNRFLTSFSSEIMYSHLNLHRYELEPSWYQIGLSRFEADCGLYFLMNCSKLYRARLLEVCSSLAYRGIGGRKSSGCGFFEFEVLENIKEQYPRLLRGCSEANSMYMQLSQVYPKADEAENVKAGYCRLRGSGGFSYAGERVVKKRMLAAVEAGSCTKNRLFGQIIHEEAGATRLFRYGKALNWGYRIEH